MRLSSYDFLHEVLLKSWKLRMIVFFIINSGFYFNVSDKQYKFQTSFKCFRITITF